MNLNEEDLNFLKELANKRLTQEKDGCADPVFWMVYDTQSVYREDGSEIGFYIDDELVYSTAWTFNKQTLEEFKNDCIEDGLVSSDDLDDFKAIEDNDDLFNYIDGFRDINIGLSRFDKEYFISSSSGPFLTKEAAIEHIKSNKHHYSKDVTTYGMVGWRNPEFEQLMKIIEKFGDKNE